jgi:nicotinamidase-related amidase
MQPTEPTILKTLEDRLDPAHTALVIIDMQKDFCVDGFATSKAGRPLDAVKALIPRLVTLLDAARAAGISVFHVPSAAGRPTPPTRSRCPRPRAWNSSTSSSRRPASSGS